MRCQCCEKLPATIQLRDVEDWAIADVVVVCDACAQLIVPQMMIPGTPMVSSAEALARAREALENTNVELEPKPTGELVVSESAQSVPDVACPGCSMRLAEFQSEGRLGCPQCYTAFRQALGRILERIHPDGGQKHTGRQPNVPAKESRPLLRRRIQELRVKMDEAVKVEDYEGAAKHRDLINEIEAALRRSPSLRGEP